MINNYKIGIVIPTCSPERKEMLGWVMDRMKRQTTPPDYIALMDYPKIRKGPDLAERYKNGIKDCFERGCDFVLFIEDDDYYPIDYIETMFNHWIQNNKPHVIGCNETTYYHIFSRGWQNMKTSEHASAHGTAVGRGVDIDSCNDGNLYFDIEIWKRNSKNCKLVYFPNHCISIKHGIGLCGGGGHTKTHYRNQDDEQYTKLRELLDDSGFTFLTAIVEKEKEKIEEEKRNNPLNPEYYDRIYLTSPEYWKQYPEASIYFPVWKLIVEKLSNMDTVVELGCGTGLFAKYAIASGIRYKCGVDFSPIAIQKSRELNVTHESKFSIKNLMGIRAITNQFTIICLEVLEHLENDLEIISRLQNNTRIIFSVPDFMCHGHQRCFDSEQAVFDYYSHLLSFVSIQKIKITDSNSIYLVEGRRI